MRGHGDATLAILDASLMAAAVVGMLLLRFDGSVPASNWTAMRVFVPFVMVLAVVSRARRGRDSPR